MSTAPRSPVVSRWELALRLKTRRLELGMSADDVSQALGFTRNYWSQVENERTTLAEDKLTLAMDVLQFDDYEKAELAELRETRERAWWDDPALQLDADAKHLIGLEHGARALRTADTSFVPGLLQTKDYAEAVIKSDPVFRAIDTSRQVRTRLARQERLTSEPRLNLTAIVSEAVIRQQIGGPEVLRRQLDHLASLIVDLDETLDVRVLPFATNPGPLIGSSTLVFMDFASPSLPTVAWQEAIRPLGIIDDETQLTWLEVCYNRGLERCLSRADSLEAIRQASRRLSR
ncbi:MAG: helix-turn-helix domain-containing protein [Acidimicrobiales bacterium]